LVLVACMLSCAVNLCGQTAQAAGGDEITRFDVDATAGADAVISVVMSFDVQFASSGHGPYVWFLTRQKYDADNDRVYTYGNFQVSSPSGAPTEFEVITETNDVQLKIGKANLTVSGKQTYVVSYTVSGIVNPHVTSSNMDEIYWNVIGTGWQIPISNVTVTIHSPADVRRTTCYAGTNFTVPCTSNSFDGTIATYIQSSLSPGEGLAVAGGWPVGTFPDAAIDLVPHSTPTGAGNLTPRNPFTFDHGGRYWAGGSAVVSVIAAWFAVHLRRKGRDEQYAGPTPGTLPAEGDETATRREEVRDAAVEFAPPKGVPPRLVGAIAREDTAEEDITATIVDMAVRGYIHMDQDTDGELVLVRTKKDPDGLDTIERRIYNGLFASGPRATKTYLSSSSFYERYLTFRSLLREEFDAQPWYEDKPAEVVYEYRTRGIMVAALGGAAALVAGFVLAIVGVPGIVWLAVPCLVLGIGMVTVSTRMPVRTPVGSVVAVQSLGFKKYLETAEADQIRWEEGQDIFSAYLPYAISFGCADHWAGVVQELVAEGALVPQPTWYSGHAAYQASVWDSICGSVHDIGTSFDRTVVSYSVEQDAARQASDSSSGASGVSGFGGGGGGGGAGGGGGGTW